MGCFSRYDTYVHYLELSQKWNLLLSVDRFQIDRVYCILVGPFNSSKKLEARTERLPLILSCIPTNCAGWRGTAKNVLQIKWNGSNDFRPLEWVSGFRASTTEIGRKVGWEVLLLMDSWRTVYGDSHRTQSLYLELFRFQNFISHCCSYCSVATRNGENRNQASFGLRKIWGPLTASSSLAVRCPNATCMSLLFRKDQEWIKNFQPHNWRLACLESRPAGPAYVSGCTEWVVSIPE